MAKPVKPDSRVLVAFTLVVLFLGVNFVAVRFSNQELPPFWGATLRFAIASAVLFVVVGVRRVPLPKDGAFTGAVLLGATAFGGNFALIYWGLLHVTSATAAIIFATVPAMTFLMAAGAKLEKFRWGALLGAAVALVGIAFIFAEQLGSSYPLGSLVAIFLGAALAAASGVIVKKFPRGHPVSINAVGMSVGTAILFVVSLVSGEHQAYPVMARTWIALGWLVTSSVVAFVLLVWVIYHWTASASSYTSLLSPLVTFVVASAIAGESISLVFLAGSAVVLVGVYLGAIRRGRT
ncbi:MAG: EamA family transporter [archaeon]|nr:MAG: EamA family transporter [archaeon]